MVHLKKHKFNKIFKNKKGGILNENQNINRYFIFFNIPSLW